MSRSAIYAIAILTAIDCNVSVSSAGLINTRLDVNLHRANLTTTHFQQNLLTKRSPLSQKLLLMGDFHSTTPIFRADKLCR